MDTYASRCLYLKTLLWWDLLSLQTSNNYGCIKYLVPHTVTTDRRNHSILQGSSYPTHREVSDICSYQTATYLLLCLANLLLSMSTLGRLRKAEFYAVGQVFKAFLCKPCYQSVWCFRVCLQCKKNIKSVSHQTVDLLPSYCKKNKQTCFFKEFCSSLCF